MKHLITESLSICLVALAFVCCAPKHNKVTGGTQPKDIIPMPVEFSVNPGSILTEVLTDEASKEMIWREGDTQYYPGGVTDPNYCVLKFTATDGRFYSDFYPRSFVL